MCSTCVDQCSYLYKKFKSIHIKWMCLFKRLGLNCSIHLDYFYNLFMNLLCWWNGLSMKRFLLKYLYLFQVLWVWRTCNWQSCYFWMNYHFIIRLSLRVRRRLVTPAERLWSSRVNRPASSSPTASACSGGSSRATWRDSTAKVQRVAVAFLLKCIFRSINVSGDIFWSKWPK